MQHEIVPGKNLTLHQQENPHVNPASFSYPAGFLFAQLSYSYLKHPMPSDNPLRVRAAIYARVSSEEQKEGQTIDSQIAELARFAEEKGWTVIGVYKDEGWSGGLLARPELDRLRDEASRGGFDIALINDVDRLARDVSHLGIVKRDLERSGVQVIFKKLPAEKSPTYNLMVNILGSFAEFERELITDRTRRGRRHKVEVRKQYIGSNSPYGYRYIPKDRASGKEGFLEVIPEEAAIVKQMFEWVDREGLSAMKVTARLSAMNVRPRRGGANWGKSSVIRILRSETYAGVWHYNKHEGCAPVNPTNKNKYRKTLKGSVRRRPKTEWLPVPLPEHLQIIDRERWQRVQEQLTRNTAFSPRNAKHSYLLKSLIKCSGCGARVVGDPCHGKFYYRCYQRCKKLPTIREEVLNDAVWRAIEEAICNPSLIIDQVKKLYAHRTQNIGKAQSEVAEVEVALQEVEVEQSRLIEAYRQGLLPMALFGKEMEQINARKTILEERKSNLTRQGEAPPLAVIERSLAEYCKIVAQQMRNFNEEARQRFLRLLVNEIIYEGSRIRIRGVLPVANSTNREQVEAKITHNQDDFFDGRIANTTTNSNARNSVIESEEIPFEISQSLPQRLTVYEQIDLEYIRQQVRQNPLITLKQLSDRIGKKIGVSPSISHIERIFRLAGISRIPGSRAKQVAAQVTLKQAFHTLGK
jgi:site-specific DNA recombinase